MESNSHVGRTAVITGAAGGFGKAAALEMAKRGADIVAVDLKPAGETVAAVQALGRRALALEVDVADEAAVNAAASEMIGFTGKVDILVNNAGVFPFIDLWDLDFATFKRMQEVNLDSQFLMTKALMGHMRDNGWGRIVNIASNSLGLAVPNMAHYMAAKGGVIGLTRALATDLAPFGIRVNAICPAPSATPGGKVNIGGMLDDLAQTQAIKRIGVSEDLTGTICFLSSDDCEFMTGQTLVCDGGLMRV